MAETKLSYPLTTLSERAMEKLRLLGEVEALTQLIYGARMQGGATERVDRARLAALDSYAELMGAALRRLQSTELQLEDISGGK